MIGRIHPTAIVSPEAVIADDVEIGPYCVITGAVEIGARTVLKSHVVIEGLTTIGADCTIYPFASLGSAPQDLKYAGEATKLIIGDRNRIREHATMNPGTVGGGGETVIGHDNLFMVGAHIAHDCRIGNHCVFANNATMAGHVIVGDHVIVGGLSAARQFVRIGPHAIIGGMTGIDNDVLPYALVSGERGRLLGLNMVGLQRRGFSRETIAALKSAQQGIFIGEGTLADRLTALASRHADDPAVMAMIDFALVKSQLGLCAPKSA